MTNEGDPNRTPPEVSKEELQWAAANLPRIRRWVTGPFFVREALVYALALGLVAHVSGYFLESGATGEPLRLLADLLSTLGTTVWTGVVLYVFLQVLPDARRREAARRLAAYEDALRDQGRSSE